MTRFPAQFAQQLRRHREMLSYAAANMLVHVIALACQFVILKFVPPERVGIWASVMIVNQYLIFTRLGIISGMAREYPFLRGRGDQKQATEVMRTAFSYVIGNGLLLAAIFVALSFLFGGSGWEWRFAFLCAALLALLQPYGHFLQAMYQVANAFRQLSVVRVVQVGVLMALIVLPWRLGFMGYCLRYVGIALFLAAALHLARPVKVKPGFRRETFRRLFSTGWRLYLCSYLAEVALSFPRLAVVWLGGPLLLGLFTPVNWMSVALSNVRTSVSGYAYPKLTYRHGREKVPVGRLALKAGLAALATTAPAVAVGIACLPWLVAAALPRYTPAVPAAQVALLSNLFESISIATFAFAITKAWKAMYIHLAISLATRAACAFGGFYLLEDRLLGVAVGILTASAVMAVVTWLMVRRMAGPNGPDGPEEPTPAPGPEDAGRRSAHGCGNISGVDNIGASASAEETG